jgi:hypothetical protein
MKIIRILSFVAALAVPAVAFANTAPTHLGWMSCCEGGCCPFCPSCPSGLHK